MNKDKLKEILMSDKPSKLIRANEEELFHYIVELGLCKGFNQNNPWHTYDVYEHTLHVVDNVANEYILRLAALFHDLGKPYTYVEDDKGIGHFPEHYLYSRAIFYKHAFQENYDEYIRETVASLVYYHDINLDNINTSDLSTMLQSLDRKSAERLFELKRADLLAQNPIYHESKLLDYDRQEKNILEKYRDLKLGRHM